MSVTLLLILIAALWVGVSVPAAVVIGRAIKVAEAGPPRGLARVRDLAGTTL